MTLPQWHWRIVGDMIHVFEWPRIIPRHRSIQLCRITGDYFPVDAAELKTWLVSALQPLNLWKILVHTCVELLTYENADYCSYKITFHICTYSPTCIYHGKNNLGGTFQFETNFVTPLIVYNTNWTTRHNSCFKSQSVYALTKTRVVCPLSSLWTHSHR